VLRRFLAVGLAVSLTWVPSARAQAPSGEADVQRGIRQVEDGDYDPAIVTLDGAARRLAADPTRSRDLAQAYLYLGIAYIGKGHEAAAKAKFREAVAQIRDLTLSADKFPPKVIDLFEAARAEVQAAAPAPVATPAPAAAAAKKGGSAKTYLIVGGLAAVGGGVALAAGGGGGSSAANGATSTTPTTTLPAETRKTQTFTGTIADQESRPYTFVATRAGSAEATVTWQNRQVTLNLDCQLQDPPYTNLGTSNRTSDTSSRLVVDVNATGYLVLVSNYSGQAGAEPFTITIVYP